jgi:hypothetical protein
MEFLLTVLSLRLLTYAGFVEKGIGDSEERTLVAAAVIGNGE